MNWNTEHTWKYTERFILPECKMVWKPHSNHTDSQSISPVLQCFPRHFKDTFQLCKVVSDAAKAFLDAPDSACCYEGAFKIQEYLTYRIVKFQSSGNLSIDLQESLTLVLNSSSGDFYYSITTSHLVHPICLCYTYKTIHYILIWHVLSIQVYIYIYTQPI